jgi:hypothetical protein
MSDSLPPAVATARALALALRNESRGAAALQV